MRKRGGRGWKNSNDEKDWKGLEGEFGKLLLNTL
jgi:hypothetical protein